MANRTLGDLEFRGCARPITEEFNLAGNYHKNDVLQAEFYRTSEFDQFFGGNILRLLRNLKKETLSETKQSVTVRKRVGYEKKKEGFQAPWEMKYGFRGNHPALYYLSAWEFTQWWFCDRLRPPTTDTRTEWTEAGLEYMALNAGNKEAEAPRAGKHYVVKPCLELPLQHCHRPSFRPCVLLSLRTCVFASLRPCVLASLRPCVLTFLRPCVLPSFRPCVLPSFCCLLLLRPTS